MISPEQFPLRIQSISYGAEGVLVFDLRSPDDGQLPEFTAGAHIDLHMPNGLMRSYSLMNDPGERHRYMLGIKRESASRGGSAWMHESARAGMLLHVSGPSNHFSLDESASHSVLVAGGIGITPLWSMAQRLDALGRSWELHYRAKTRAGALLLKELGHSRYAGRVHLTFTEKPASGRLDMAQVVEHSAPHSHFYCCGPLPMIQSFEEACAGLDASHVHFEYFSPKEAPATEGGYIVRLAQSKRDIAIQAGETILESLRACGIAVPSSCQQGVCGVCETRVIAGTPDHRDLVLTDQERQAGKSVMICCSGSLTDVLELDL